ncbi:hypothetical protein CO083_06560 [Candidatus Roizmanbacteria bacterium CG_4_9_14_0_8_um_filter_34_12]|uniref:Helix-turn-helix type 11 domain-containing protein n=2 Tax=Candidatus Roizmaniibacteriota TaxID=1752723 RepID=A0A2M7M0E4_9BACT|nr:MAG: hypothetical protein COZ39_01865 [Candidatus Roizmanbacteria bacterium CG_4_10_14_3_um_filter_33_21]PJB87522.1 MAG: hypothetical protein CO083_06560 [Candidatus Roizmanbacteria bacterium CG_4_9_14_0_8_um_filter_34_12]
MVTNTARKIQEYLIVHKQVTSKQLSEYLGISRQALFRHLPKLLAEGKIGKIGKPPVVFYQPPQRTYGREPVGNN